MENTQVQKPDTTVSCSTCGAQDKWNYIKVYTHRIATGEQLCTHEELRCGNCGRKAIKSVEKEIRASPIFMEANKEKVTV